MKRLISTSAALVLAAVLTPAAQAQDTPSGAGAAAACAFGSCFVPRFDSVGQVNTYTGPGAAGNVRVEFADCCVAGTSYRVSVFGNRSTADVVFTGLAPLNSNCSVGPYLGSQAVEIRGARTIRYKALALNAGTAGAYLRIRQAGWIKNPAVDACGF